jgi:hypothetical protein
MATVLLLPLTLGVAGHRDIFPADFDRAASAVTERLIDFSLSYPHTPLRLMCGMAEGADRLVARVFLDVRERLVNDKNQTAEQWELVVVLPMVVEAYREDFPNSIKEFNDLLDRASAVITLPGPTAAVLSGDTELRTQCHEALGHHLLRHSNVLLALWDGVQLPLRGGTSHIVRMKREGLDDAHARFTVAVHDCGPVWHLPVRRQSTNTSSASNPRDLTPQWLYPVDPYFSKEVSEKHWRSIDVLNERLLEFVQPDTARKVAGDLSPDFRAIPESHDRVLGCIGPLDRRMVGVFAGADILAQRLENKRRILSTWMYILGGCLAFSLWTAIDGVLQMWMAGAYVVLILAVATILWRIRKSDLSEDLIHYRFLTEALRVQFYWSLAHVTSQTGTPTLAVLELGSRWEVLRVLDALLSQQAHEIGWVREALRIGAINPTSGSTVPASLRTAHFEHWIKQQFDYHQKREGRLDRQSGLQKNIALTFVGVGILTAAAVIGIDAGGRDLHILRHVVSIAAAVLPAFALLLQSYGDRLALEEQAKSAIRMQSVFGRAARRIADVSSKHGISRTFLRSLGEEALAESAYWLLLRKSKPPSMPR